MRILRASLIDAKYAVDADARAIHYTVPLGYTPLGERPIEDADIGARTWRADVEGSVFITGASTCWGRINYTERLLECLAHKANIVGSMAGVGISKSDMAEVLELAKNKQPSWSRQDLAYPTTHLSARSTNRQ